MTKASGWLPDAPNSRVARKAASLPSNRRNTRLMLPRAGLPPEGSPVAARPVVTFAEDGRPAEPRWVRQATGPRRHWRAC